MKKQFWLVRFFPLGVLLSLSLGSCLDEVLLEAPRQDQSGIAIRAELKRIDPEPYISVSISRLSDFVFSEIPEPVLDASVVLIDDEGIGLDIPMREPGKYELTIPDSTYALEVKPGRRYRLSVATREGRNYLSSSEILNPVPEPTAVGLTTIKRAVLNDVGNIVDQEFYRFLLTTPLIAPGQTERSLLKWTFLGTYKFTETTKEVPMPPDSRTCFFFEDLNLDQVVVFNGAESRSEVLTDFLLLEEERNYRFTEGFYLTLFQQSLSEGAYSYWEKAGRLAALSGNFFDAPPGKVVGNFHNPDDPEEEVFGYFYATEEVIFRYYVDPGENRVRPFCPSLAKPEDVTVNYLCWNCLAHPRSTLEKPAFWEF